MRMKIFMHLRSHRQSKQLWDPAAGCKYRTASCMNHALVSTCYCLSYQVTIGVR